MTVPVLKKPLSRRPYLSGTIFWVLFALVAVLIRGVRWDENYEFAQVILGQVPYPDGHPLAQYVRGFYSLQTYTLAGLMYFFPGPLLANLIRNWLYLAASTVPVFLLGALFARRQLVGHVAVIFVLLEVHQDFYSSYPIEVWPDAFSNGPVGLGYMLFTLWALLDRRNRLAGALLGLAPAVHLGQFPPLLVTALLFGLHLARSGETGRIRQVARYAGLGLIVSVAFAVVLRLTRETPPASGPYFSAIEPEMLWHTYMAHYATHRAIPFSTGHLVLLAGIVIMLALLVLRRAGVPEAPAETAPSCCESPRFWGLLYVLVLTALVWGIMAAHYVMGPDVPFLLVGWLPYRLMNHASPILIPILLALGYDRDRRVPFFLPVLLLMALVAPLLHLVLDPAIMARYLDSSAYLYFMLAGAVAGEAVALVYRRKLAFGAAALVVAAILVAALALFHQFGSACICVGFLMGAAPGLSRVPQRVLQASTVGIACLLLASMMAHQYMHRSHLERSAFQIATANYLAEHGEPDAMIAVPYMQIGEQMKTGHPVTADMATFLHCGYRPELAPAINAIFEDFYGITLDPARYGMLPARAWHQVWPAKPLEEWQALAAKYQVHYVAAPRFMTLPLQPVVTGEDRVLYRIPNAAHG